MAEPNAMLSANRLCYGKPTGELLQRNVSFQVRPGQLLLITGANGSGKSTFLRVLLGELSPSDGSFQFHVPGPEIICVPQLENTHVHLPLTLADIVDISVNSRAGWKEAALALGLMNREDFARHWNTSSGGERKRAMLTRALMGSPRALLLDEPMNHLDESTRRRMVGVISRYLRDQDRIIVMICHQGLLPEERANLDVVDLDLDQTAVFAQGHIC